MWFFILCYAPIEWGCENNLMTCLIKMKVSVGYQQKKNFLLSYSIHLILYVYALHLLFFPCGGNDLSHFCNVFVILKIYFSFVLQAKLYVQVSFNEKSAVIYPATALFIESNITFTFTFMHLADAFIQSDLHCIQVTVFYILPALAFPGNRTHDLGVASAMLYHLSYRKTNIEQ